MKSSRNIVGIICVPTSFRIRCENPLKEEFDVFRRLYLNLEHVKRNVNMPVSYRIHHLGSWKFLSFLNPIFVDTTHLVLLKLWYVMFCQEDISPFAAADDLWLEIQASKSNQIPAEFSVLSLQPSLIKVSLLRMKKNHLVKEDSAYFYQGLPIKIR